MTGRILYCGDTELSGAASYLAGLITSWGWDFDYVPSAQLLTAKDLDIPRPLIILSDYPSTQFPLNCQQLALSLIERGCGLLMIGGWESYYGFGGNWHQAALSAALPVEIQSADDRINFEQSAWLLPTMDHPITNGLPWQSNPPAIGGMNRVNPKPNSTVVIKAHRYSVVADSCSTAHNSPGLEFTLRESFPALVVGQQGQGRTASFLSDVAPHWVGGLVDWGLPRVTAQAEAGFAIEVGHHYSRFWKQLLQWVGQISG